MAPSADNLRSSRVDRRSFLGMTASALAAAGCGGGASILGGETGGGGRLQIEVIWPERSESGTRVIPLAANSMKFRITPMEAPWTDVVREETVGRPPNGKSVIQINALPLAKLRVDVTAHPGAGGGGLPLGTASQVVEFSATKTVVIVSFKMESTVFKIQIQNDQERIDLLEGLEQTIVPTALNADLEVLLLYGPPRNWQFMVGNSSIASITADGRMKGLKPGETTLTIKAVEPDGNGNPVVVEQRVYPVKVTAGKLALLGVPERNPDGSLDPPGLYLQSLTTTNRQMLVRTTGQQWTLTVNPANTRIFFVAQVVHADRTDPTMYCYVINADGTGLRQILLELESWQRINQICYMAGGKIAISATRDGSNATSGIWVVNDDGTGLELFEQIDNVGWMVPFPAGDEVAVWGTRSFTDTQANVTKTSTGFWYFDDNHDYFLLNGTYEGTYLTPVHARYLWDPLPLGINDWMGLSEPLLDWKWSGGVAHYEFGRRAYWRERPIVGADIWAEVSEVDSGLYRTSVARDGRHATFRGLRLQRIESADPGTIYLWNIASDTFVATEAGKGWAQFTEMALFNLD